MTFTGFVTSLASTIVPIHVHCIKKFDANEGSGKVKMFTDMITVLSFSPYLAQIGGI